MISPSDDFNRNKLISMSIAIYVQKANNYIFFKISVLKLSKILLSKMI